MPETRLIFVTGTDTGVGKSVVTATLARHLRQQGIKVGVMKPVESGVSAPELLGADARLLKWAAESNADDALICPYRFQAALSPDQAAKQEQRRIEFDTIETAVNELAANHQFLLIEGAGGLMVPLAGGLLVADLVKRLGAELLVVTRPDLGTLNHTLLTIFAARSLEIPLLGMVLNRMPQAPDLAQQNAPHALASLASCDLLACMDEQSGSDQEIVTKLAAELPEQEGYGWLAMRLGLQLQRSS